MEIGRGVHARRQRVRFGVVRDVRFELNNGVEMPALGLGVYQSSPRDTVAAVERAIAEGYRLIDTAASYFNEKEVGKAIRHSDVDRSELFVTTKLWITDFGYDQTLHAFERSLRKLGLDEIDLYLVHWPVPSAFEKTIASWKAAERLLGEGRVRAIGVSNFTAEHLAWLGEESDVVPAVNQVELHPFFAQPDLREMHARLGIVTQAWSPIGGVSRYHRTGADPLHHPVLEELAAAHGKSVAQIILRWHLQNGISAIPKSTNAERIAENIDVFDFDLDEEEMRAIDALNTNSRSGLDPLQVSPRSLPIAIHD